MMRHGCNIITALLLGLLPLSALADTAPKHVYNVAVDAEYAPYEFRDVDGEVKGMLPDMLRAIGKSTGIEFRFTPMNWPDAVKALEQGKVDILNMIRTPQRIGKYEFSNPHTMITQALFRNKSETEIQDVHSIDGHIVALQHYDIANEKLANQHNFDRHMVDSKSEGFLKLDAGEIAAFFTAEQPGLYFIQQHDLKHVELAAVGLWPQAFCFTARKGNTAIIALLNKGLAGLKHGGSYGRIVRQWSIKPAGWIARNATALIAAAAILLLITISLWLWVFMLRRTVKIRTSELLMEHERLQQSETQHRSLLETMPGALLLVQDGFIAYANHAALSMFGMDYSETQEAGGKARRPFMNFVPDRCQELVNNHIHQIYASNQSIPATEGKLLRMDRSEFDAEVIAAPYVFRGRPAAQLIIFDITERKQSETQVERLLSIIETSSDFIGMADAAGSVMYINPAGLKMVGLSASRDVQGMSIDHLHSPDEMKRMRHEIFPAALQHGGYQTEITFLGKDDEEIPTLAAFSVQKNPDGTAASYAIIAHDIRKEKEQQQRLEHIQRLDSLGVLAGGIAHDFNNILTAILGNAAIAERKAISQPQEMPKYLNNIIESSEKAAALCKQMLAYSGKGKFVVKAINLSDMVNGITKLLEVSIAKNVVLKYQLTAQLPAVEADVAQIQQVMMNLVINASDAIGDHSGVISIATGMMYADRAYLKETCIDTDISEGRYVFLEISDTGCGMDKQTRQRIFEPFFTTKSTGHGLGMSAVLGIVRGHHGTLKLYSEPGNGTTFKILLPACGWPAEALENKPAMDKQWQGSGTVLIIDDEATIRETAAIMLEDMGFTTITAENGLDGVAVYQRHQHEIVAVLLDMTMPKLDGQGCFRELRRINKEVKVILSSGYNEQEATSRFTGKGLAGFIQKPYRPEMLAKAIRTALS